VCLGHQCIAQHFGATISKAKTLMHGKTSNINHIEKGIFTNIAMPMQVTRYHSLIVLPETLPEDLIVSAWTTNNQGDIDDIMALQHKSLPIVSVQFHPESVLTLQGMELLKNFIYLYSDK
jgi:anthranilate synthase/aminodeoxychorismate synthase-like glutamine amidotransferase